MSLTIFYSWQSDTPKAVNRNFIEDALEKAIKKLHATLTVEEALRDEKLELDKDTKGVPGIPPIADVIFDKISQCAIFVPDITFVGRTEDGRRISNPNVLIEYGWALKVVTHSRMIPVMNTFYGEPNAETLPFDMRHLRHPITYRLDENAAPEEKAQTKEQLTSDLIEAIRLILKSGVINNLPAEDSAFQEIPYTLNPSTFLGEREPLSSEPLLLLPNVSRLFLRIIPTMRIEEIKTSKAALDIVRSGSLVAMDREGQGYRYDRNRYGAFAYDNNENQVLNLTQLFKNGELWGIDSYLIDKNRLMSQAKVDIGFFPSSAFEKIFVYTLTNYLLFIKDTLKLSLPIRFIAGATDVAGYRMAAPQGMNFGGFERFAGNVVENHIIYEGLITDYDVKAADILRPFFNLLWEECDLERPDKEIL